MNIDSQTITKLKKLSMLEVENENEIISSLQEIINFTDNLQSLNTDNLQHKNFNRLIGYSSLRDDEFSDLTSVDNSAIIDNAPKSENSFFIVPKIL